MRHYVIVDGQLQRSSIATQSWVRRAAKVVPLDTEEKPDVLALPEDRRTEYQIIEGLEETE